MTRRRTRSTIALLTAVLVATAGSAEAAAGRTWHRTLALGSGKRKVRVSTCNVASASGQMQTHYRAVTRKSSDRHAPRITIKITEGSSEAGAEFSLFPGDLTQTDSSGPWSAAAQARFTIHNQGKVKHKRLTVGQIGPC